jgi:Zn-finger nucleic acid-binding protein
MPFCPNCGFKLRDRKTVFQEHWYCDNCECEWADKDVLVRETPISRKEETPGEHQEMKNDGK